MAEFVILKSGWAFIIGGQAFPAVEKNLQSNGKKHIDIKKLSFDGGAKAETGVEIGEAADKGAAGGGGAVAESDVD
ncbi:hypothetical protein IEQ34_015778 [Dendrobium chrysotoxum]|uniref:Uncharacterized protein n=1 Tax=Dendrobium chrysotoxum TaxID=161865 RepID=A0AAV7GGS8_DENCH|nr:hypothetical protein IEQ34_015778 [Dendrobium chrysotoxum]